MKRRARSIILLFMGVGCQRAAPTGAGEEAVTARGSARIAPAIAPERAFPFAQTQEDPASETRWIATRWSRDLPFVDLRERMCPTFEASADSRNPPLDAWGTPFRVRCDRASLRYVFVSAGPDKNFETADDLLLMRGSLPTGVASPKL
jgi:hypothetical protein